jgi:arginase
MSVETTNCHVDIIGFPIDLGAARRGVDMGASALRIAGIHRRLEKLGYQVSDLGDVVIRNMERQQVDNHKLKYLDEIVRTNRELAQLIKDSMAQDHFPLCLGGDHSLAIGSIAGISAHCKDVGKRLGLIWVDAHADMNTEKTTPSGNIHGMSLAVALGQGAPALTEIFGFSPKLVPENCAVVGVRSVDRLERAAIQKIGLPVYTMTDIDRRSVSAIIREVLDRLASRVDQIHVSFDMDSIEPGVAPGVGTPVSGGLSYREAHLIMETIAESGQMASLDIAEVNPILDSHNKSAELAAELVASAMGQRIL